MDRHDDEVGYAPVSKEEESDDSVLSSDPSDAQLLHHRQSSRSRIITGLNVVLFLFSLAILYRSTSDTKRENWALEQVSFFSPIFDRLKIPLVDKIVQGTLFDEHDILLRRYPSPEVDTAWSTLTDVGVVIIQEAEVSRLGKDPKNTVRAPPGWGHGDNAHLAQPDGQHALHCLNAIRRYAYREYYYPSQTTCPSSDPHAKYNATSPLAEFHQAHLSHCLHILLQTLTCDFSTDMITHNWMETQDYPFPDFAINKKCKDHSKILEWQTRERISEAQWMEMSMRGPQEGDTVLGLPPKLKAWTTASNGKDKQAEGGD
ncbi:hypothetical protein BJ875DRAFT_491967 [Amylocarpus encephaloides]|uniref:Tat pathway signal sequence n=1 Tax=Amylocarpus encephaloides TaxID=45428 RepID=A0A9P7YTT3_9HELO|nr:hypothetical protein BJ875DRAFT_491967 [Amylocarpus encephaloides]